MTQTQCIENIENFKLNEELSSDCFRRVGAIYFYIAFCTGLNILIFALFFPK